MGKINTKESQVNTEITVKKVRGVPFKVGKDDRRNLNGKPKGVKSFDTLFDEAIRIIVKEQKIPNLKTPEIDLVVKAVVEGLKGNYPYFRDLMDRRYGKAPERIDLSSGGEPLGIIFLPRRKQDENKQLNKLKL